MSKKKQYIDNDILKNLGVDIVKMKLEGFPTHEIFDFVWEKYPNLTYDTFEGIQASVNEQIIRQSAELAVEVINAHIVRYDQIYHFFITHGLLPHAKKALEAKESLMGYHSDVYQFQVNNVLTNETQAPTFAPEKLNPEQNKRFLQLINKATPK